MKYDDLFEVVQEALVKREIHSNRIAGDVTRAVMRALETEPAQHGAQRTADNVATCPHGVQLGTHCHFCGDL